jgi:hypothetical protein
MTTFSAFLDTCAINGGHLADTLLRLAEASIFRPRRLRSPARLNLSDMNAIAPSSASRPRPNPM